MTLPPTSPVDLEEAVTLAARHLGLSRAELLEALGPRVVNEMIALASAGVESGRISLAATEEGIALIVWYLHPRQRFQGASLEGQPSLATDMEVLASLEDLAANHGIALVDLILFLREAAETRSADALTVLRLIDRIETRRRTE